MNANATAPVLRELRALDRALGASQWPLLSRWWFDTFVAFVGSLCRQLVLRVGRRGGKSSSLCRFAVAFALAYDRRQIPPGDVGVVAFISTSRDEASQRLRTIKAILDALAVAWKPIEGGIELVGRPIAFKVYTASVSGVSGFTGILVICDEVAKWKDSDTGANPATEVLASVRPTIATQPAALIILSSSPLGLDDGHAKAFAAGDTAHQLTAYAPTWEANPTISEEQTRRDEPDERIWSREYAAIPQAAKLAAFDAAAVARAFDPLTDGGERLGQRFGVIDASSGKKDAFTFAVCGWRMVAGARRLVVEHVDGFEDRFYETTGGERIVSAVARAMRDRGVVEVFGDQRESLMIASAFARHGLRFRELPWTSTTKERAVATVRRWLADGALVLPAHTKLRSELLSFEERTTPNGGFTFGARGSGHDDYVSLLITAAMADATHGHRGASMVEALRAGLRRDRGEEAPTTSAPARRTTLSEALRELDRPAPRRPQITDAADFSQLHAMANASRPR